jgi:hypothetical protein
MHWKLFFKVIENFANKNSYQDFCSGVFLEFNLKSYKDRGGI